MSVNPAPGAVTAAQMKRIDETAIREYGIPSLTLMENAASRVADAAEALPEARRGVLLLCGSGNNGGDGLACARLLKKRGFAVRVLLAGDPERRTPDCAENLRRLAAAGVGAEPYTGQPLPECGCIVDALFGFGLNRELTGLYRQAVEAVNRASVPVVACDIPSGLCADTGEVMGTAVRAAQTVCFTLPKRGLLLPCAAPFTGRLTVVQIGIPAALLEKLS